jgi:hypothetical protein
MYEDSVSLTRCQRGMECDLGSKFLLTCVYTCIHRCRYCAGSTIVVTCMDHTRSAMCACTAMHSRAAHSWAHHFTRYPLPAARLQRVLRDCAKTCVSSNNTAHVVNRSWQGSCNEHVAGRNHSSSRRQETRIFVTKTCTCRLKMQLLMLFD